MTSNTELAKNFIKNHNIKNFQQLNELLREFYYARGENKTNLIKEYGSEDLTAFNWMQKKYIKGSIGKLKSLFTEFTIESFPGTALPVKEAVKRFVIVDLPQKGSQAELHTLSDNTHNPGGNINIPKNSSENIALRQAQSFRSTRHKANPDNTDYRPVDIPEKIISKDQKGTNKEYSFIKTETLLPEFKNVNEIFVTYFTPAEEEIIKQQDISNEAINQAKKTVEDYYSFLTSHSIGKKESEGIKHNKNKLPIDLVLNRQFPNAVKALSVASFYGHEKYKETDQDWMNFSRTPQNSQGYADAAARHNLEKNTEDKESNLPHIFHKLWNVMAETELWIKENKIDMNKFAESYLENLHNKK